jgi:hypothetical protein
MNEQMSESQSLLRIALRGNALFSIVSSVLILAGCGKKATKTSYRLDV